MCVGKITSANGENKAMFDTVTTTDAEESEISKKTVRTRGGPSVSWQNFEAKSRKTHVVSTIHKNTIEAPGTASLHVQSITN